MPPAQSPLATRLPRWLVWVASLAILFHLGAVTFRVLAVPSGPWPSMEGLTMYSPPQFAFTITSSTLPGYLQPLKLAHHYHFDTNRPGQPGVYFTVKLRDEAGSEIATVEVPNKNAPCWVRHREEMLARWLGNDIPVPPPQGEVIAPPQGQVPTVQIWDPGDNRALKLRTVPEHLVPRDRPVMRPSEFALVLARSYSRHLCRHHGAASAELSRHHKDAYPPNVLSLDNIPAGAFDEQVSIFGEYRP